MFRTTRAGSQAVGAGVLVEFLRRPRLEVIPLDGVERDVIAHVPRDVTLTVTSSPTKGIEATLALCERLTGHGHSVVAHLAARLVSDRGHLREILARLDGLGVRDVFVVAGDIEHPAGEFQGAAALLAAMAEVGHDLREIGITGYPESHAFISDETTIQAMFDKAPLATYIVSQICFDPAVIDTWVRRVRDRGVELPIYVGLPGPVSAARLVRLSGRIGLGDSARFLRGHGSWVGRLMRPRAYRPEQLLERLGASLGSPDRGVAGLHFFTFNEIERTERWRQETIARLAGPGRPADGRCRYPRDIQWPPGWRRSHGS
jgi:methylenetetrahydrofolate reductase (NADPH)